MHRLSPFNTLFVYMKFTSNMAARFNTEFIAANELMFLRLSLIVVKETK